MDRVVLVLQQVRARLARETVLASGFGHSRVSTLALDAGAHDTYVMTGTDTIFALSSGPGRAGVAVIRVSGPHVGTALTDIAGSVPAPRLAALRRLRRPGTGDVLDDALVLFFEGPRSETGEDMGEFHVHGGRAVVQSVLAALGAIEGCRMAEPGEFARRAFHNGKLDLTAVEGLADLVDAETEAQRRQAIRQAGGALARLYDGWRSDLITALALVEAAIDFSDEGDVADETAAAAVPRVEFLLGAVESHLANANRGEIARSGFHVVIAGPPNVGKSSLLNALARRDVAIVSEEAGTTRDVIEVRLDLDGYAVVVSDTAGLREAEGAIEREGMRRTIERARAADLVIWLVDAQAETAEPPPEVGESARVRWVVNKIDLRRPDLGRFPPGTLAISATTGEGLETLTGRLAEMVRDAASGPDDLTPTQERHRQQLEQAKLHLGAYLAADKSELELRAEDLRLAARALGRLTGRVDPEHVFDQIFSRFCIGK